MEVNDQINTCTAPKTINVTTAIATGSSPVEIDSQLETYDIKDENSLDIVALEQSRLLPQSVLDDILLHKGSFTMTFRATLKIEGQANRHVVVRRLLPELAELEAHRLAFMGSISLAAALAHPNIVAFMGVYDPTLREYNLDEFLSPSWQDTQPSVVTEHMANGDLRTMLRLHSRNKNEFGWFHSTSVPKTKVQVALDIVDALVYLHSQPNTLLHHLQLMAKRVLLSELWDAKLCAFSVHRALGTASTTSCTDSSVAWLAPELLRGEPRSEQTDVYALGVLLTELDTCQLPFSLGMDMDDEMDEQTQLALLVSSGCIRPALSIDCPLQIQELVMRCLSFSPEQRSPAIEVQHMLRKLINGTSICNLSLSSLPSNVSSLESITID
ncbi:hypothetical protein PsorP6_002868 [Peronosclerospora sorghi]|uniref:Uncharacterized protein n=1 Tax=Peronosclerospora sorghi TaxID=230839 RepID=A0ACC0VLG1_9STRA|nr:hypothetical protein PsorP6_002868 [Peronosclerospora sorghi]